MGYKIKSSPVNNQVWAKKLKYGWKFFGVYNDWLKHRYLTVDFFDNGYILLSRYINKKEREIRYTLLNKDFDFLAESLSPITVSGDFWGIKHFKNYELYAPDKILISYSYDDFVGFTKHYAVHHVQRLEEGYVEMVWIFEYKGGYSEQLADVAPSDFKPEEKKYFFEDQWHELI